MTTVTQVTEHDTARVERPVPGLAAYSMWLRELTRFRRQKSRLAGAAGTPLLFWLVLGAGFGGSFRPTSGLETTRYFEYFFPGIIVLTVLFAAVYSTISVIEDRQEGFLQGVLVAPVSRVEIVLGKMLGGTTLGLIQGVLLLLLAPLAGLKLGIVGFTEACGLLFLVAFGLTGLGLLIAWTMSSSSGFHAIMNLLLMPMWLLSGAVFPYSDAHPAIRALMTVNPLSYGMAGFRQALYIDDAASHGHHWPMWLCVLITVVFALATLYGSIAMANRKGDSGR